MKNYRYSLLVLLLRKSILILLFCTAAIADDIPVLTNAETVALEKLRNSASYDAATAIIGAKAMRLKNIIDRMTCHIKLDGYIDQSNVDGLISEIENLVGEHFNANEARASFNEFTICLNSMNSQSV